jgi:hypothetical protein
LALEGTDQVDPRNRSSSVAVAVYARVVGVPIELFGHKSVFANVTPTSRERTIVIAKGPSSSSLLTKTKASA